MTNLQIELLREEARIRTTLIDIQGMMLPHMEIMQKRMDHARTLVKERNLSVANHMYELSAELQIDLHILKVLQDNWDKNLSIILKVHNNFISHFGITL